MHRRYISELKGTYTLFDQGYKYITLDFGERLLNLCNWINLFLIVPSQHSSIYICLYSKQAVSFVNISDCISDLCCFITRFRKPTKLNTVSRDLACCYKSRELFNQRSSLESFYLKRNQVTSSSFPPNIIVKHGQLILHCISNKPGLWAEEHSSILNPNALPSLQVLLGSLSWQHLFIEVTSAVGCCSIYQEQEQQLSDSTLNVTADHSQRQTIQYHELFNEKKGQGKGLVT